MARLSGREIFNHVRAHRVSHEYEMASHKTLEVEITRYIETDAEPSTVADSPKKQADMTEDDTRRV